MQNDVARKFLLVKKIISQVSSIDENQNAHLPYVLSTVTPCMMLILADANGPSPLKNVSKLEPALLVKHLMTFSVAGLQAAKQLYL